MHGCGALSFPEKMALGAVKFWAENSFQHAEVLLKSGEPNGATLYPYFQEELTKLYDAFKEMYDTLDKDEEISNPYDMIYLFLTTNHYFIRLLERLKFEGYNGFPILYEITYHFLYEQLYVDQIFSSMFYSGYKAPEDVVIQGVFRKMGLGNSPLDCIYGHMYFWSLIGAEHCSILMSSATAPLPEKTNKQFEKFRDLFNKCDYELSSIYDDLDVTNLGKVFMNFRKINMEFLEFLKDFQNDDTYLPESLKKTLPDLYFGVLQHIIDEHTYVLRLCVTMGEVLGYKKEK